MNKDTGQEPPMRTLAAGLGLLTALVLLCAAGILATDLVSAVGAEPPPIVPSAGKAAAGVEMPWMTLLRKTMLMVAIMVAMVVIAPLVGALCLFGLLRRYGKQLGPLIHLEYASPPPAVVGQFSGPALGGAAAACTAQPLNLGPSFEEERLRHAAQTSRMESGVLRQLFEDNLKLQEKIGIARAAE